MRTSGKIIIAMSFIFAVTALSFAIANQITLPRHPAWFYLTQVFEALCFGTLTIEFIVRRWFAGSVLFLILSATIFGVATLQYFHRM